MPLAVLLTGIAILGIGLGVTLGQSRRMSSHLAAAGGGLLLGIALFALLPEAAIGLGWASTLGFASAVCGLLIWMDRWLLHRGTAVLLPLLALTAVHGFLDGWSVRAATVGPIAEITVPLGLALHKLPEGLALGWIIRRHHDVAWSAFLAGSVAESTTLLGAFVQPGLELAGQHRFGFAWTVIVISFIAGSFCFLGAHAVWPARKQKTALALFAGTLLAVYAAARIH